MLIFFKVNNLGEDLGPEFILWDNFGLTSPYLFTRDELLTGVTINVNENAVEISVQSTGSLCKNCCLPDIIKKYTLPPKPTTTTTSTSTTTSTTTIVPTTTTTSTSTTSTTTVFPVIYKICFHYGNEGVQNTCSVSSEITPFNGKPYFIIKDVFDCTSTPSWGPAYVYWSISNNRWEFGNNLGNSGVALGSFLYNYLENPGFTPVSSIIYEWSVGTNPAIAMLGSSTGDCCNCVEIRYDVPATYTGTYIDCNGEEQPWVIPEAGDPFTYVCTSELLSIQFASGFPSVFLLSLCYQNLDDSWSCPPA
jgi:hypothetical protein